MNILLTERDCDLMRWINRYGFVTMEYVAQWLNVSSSTAYKRIKKLVDNKFLLNERVTFKASVYYVSCKGIRASCSSLPALRKISLPTYYHDLQVLRLSMALIKHFGGSYVTERELRQEQGKEAFGQKTHMSDGGLVLPDKRIAIEVELNKKSKWRREKIFDHYMKSFQYQAVWYFYTHEEIKREIEPVIRGVDWMQLYPLNEFS